MHLTFIIILIFTLILITILTITFTSARMAIRRRQSARYLVPEAVLEYIDRHNLYLSLPAAVTYDDLASPAATGETSTSGDAMQESSYSIPSHYSYPSTSKIIDTLVD